jgi:hypothetical protein
MDSAEDIEGGQSFCNSREVPSQDRSQFVASTAHAVPLGSGRTLFFFVLLWYAQPIFERGKTANQLDRPTNYRLTSDDKIFGMELGSKRMHATSALGQKRTHAVQQGMSAFPIATAKADIGKPSCLLYPQKRTCAVH